MRGNFFSIKACASKVSRLDGSNLVTQDFRDRKTLRHRVHELEFILSESKILDKGVPTGLRAQ